MYEGKIGSRMIIEIKFGELNNWRDKGSYVHHKAVAYE
jgi:hypothetical protein